MKVRRKCYHYSSSIEGASEESYSAKQEAFLPRYVRDELHHKREGEELITYLVQSKRDKGRPSVD